MKYKADKRGKVRFFYAKLGRKEEINTREVDLLTAGEIPELIPPTSVEGRKNRKIKYDISQYTTLNAYLNFSLNKEQSTELILQCINLFRRMRKKYLKYENLVLNFNKVFIGLHDRKLRFIFIPVITEVKKVELRQFFIELITEFNKDSYEMGMFCDRCMAELNRAKPFVLEEFGLFVQNAADSRYVDRPREQDHRVNSVESEFQSIDSESTMRLENVGAMLERAFLLRTGLGERTELVGSPFVLGSNADKVSYCVEGNASISRRHAEFIMRDGNWSVSDLDSTNGTFVNGERLAPRELYKLRSGDCIRLGNEDFDFVIGSD